jgi:hypothetical protein
VEARSGSALGSPVGAQDFALIEDRLHRRLLEARRISGLPEDTADHDRILARTVSLIVQSMLTFSRTRRTSSRAMIARV